MSLFSITARLVYKDIFKILPKTLPKSYPFGGENGQTTSRVPYLFLPFEWERVTKGLEGPRIASYINY